ncbi:MAG TPA: hypothetical protein VG738_08115 [Chitinophagaceae bacterium]|nr:hypothetical protein [Chitinophagaceae bacterium]
MKATLYLLTLEETLKEEVWARGTLKEAFNTFVITNMHVRKDGELY